MFDVEVYTHYKIWNTLLLSLLGVAAESNATAPAFILQP